MREDSLSHEYHAADVDAVDFLVVFRRDCSKGAGELECSIVDEDVNVWAECVGSC